MTTEKKICFVISPIGADGSDIRRRADPILRHIITPAVTACGFEPMRSDQISEPGLITTQVIQHIIEDPLVIADLTGSNPNVFYELAIRHAIRKPLIQIIHKEEKIPFDVAGMRTVPVDHRDLDSVQEAKQEIERQVQAVTRKRPGEKGGKRGQGKGGQGKGEKGTGKEEKGTRKRGHATFSPPCQPGEFGGHGIRGIRGTQP